MSLHTWQLFVLATFFVSGTPGPNMLHILTRSVDFGFRRSIAAMAGCLTGNMLLMTASALGLAAVFIAVPGVFQALRLIGVGYLIYLGLKAWRSGDAPIDVGTDTLKTDMSTWRLYRGGLAISVSNPKAILFATAFLPQFINAAAPKVPQFGVLVLTFAIVETAWYVTYALGGRSLVRALARPWARTLFNRVTGGLFVAFGLALLKAKPA